MDLQTFLTSYNLDEAALREAGVSPQELALIEQEYQAIEGTLRENKQRMLDKLAWSIEHVQEDTISRTSRTGTL